METSILLKLNYTLDVIFPPLAAGLAGFIGGDPLFSIALGVITRLLLYVFDAQIRWVAIKVKSVTYYKIKDTIQAIKQNRKKK